MKPRNRVLTGQRLLYFGLSIVAAAACRNYQPQFRPSDDPDNTHHWNCSAPTGMAAAKPGVPGESNGSSQVALDAEGDCYRHGYDISETETLTCPNCQASGVQMTIYPQASVHLFAYRELLAHPDIGTGRIVALIRNVDQNLGNIFYLPGDNGVLGIRPGESAYWWVGYSSATPTAAAPESRYFTVINGRVDKTVVKHGFTYHDYLQTGNKPSAHWNAKSVETRKPDLRLSPTRAVAFTNTWIGCVGGCCTSP
ncbi:MAG: hypothetical protein NVS4B3_03050 [Gemmatimonadaceae bacterium]